MVENKTMKALGKKEVTIGDRTFELTIKIGDSRNYIKEVSKLKKAGTEELAVDTAFDFFMTLATRDQKLTVEENEEMQLFAELHLTELMKEIPIALGVAKREDLEKKDELKN